jgi:hypothetical protein
MPGERIHAVAARRLDLGAELDQLDDVALGDAPWRGIPRGGGRSPGVVGSARTWKRMPRTRSARMYATIRSYGASELVAELRRHEEAIKSLIGSVSGFRAYYLVETPGGGAVSITVCDDQAGAEESNAVAAGWIRENLGGMSIPPPAIAAGEVAFSTTA